jgi:hypothetical protein
VAAVTRAIAALVSRAVRQEPATFTISDLRFTILSEAMRQPKFAADKQHDSAKLTPR